MKVGQCPSCGAAVEFRAGTGRVKVCEHCSTVVARADSTLTAVGTVAELADTESPLQVGLRGRYSGTDFLVAGRLQKSHGAGTWDEWYLAFDDGREAWLSESEGQWNLMFEASDAALPPLDALQPLTPFSVRERRFVVEEVGEATTVSAQGELPDFAARHPYVDATGPGGVFCSLDYGADKPLLFVGSTVTLDALGFDKGELAPTPRRAALSQARCTNCNGPLELKAPDRAMRVACPYCAALLDVSHGRLAFLKLLEKPPYQPRLALGAKGVLFGHEWVVLAFLIRSCRVEGVRYGWEEYLLWHREQGFRWLLQSNGHWTFLTPVPAGDCVFGGRTASYRGESFKQFQSVMAVTEYVLGECYWQVQAGEQAFASEFVAPPRSLNVDRVPNEATVTLGELLEREAVSRAFGVTEPLPRPSGVAPAQVNPWSARTREAWKWAGLWAVGLLAVFVALSATATRGVYLEQRVQVPDGARPGGPEAMAFSSPFEIPQAAPLDVAVSCPGLSNSWCGVQVDLVNEKTDEVISVYGEADYYFGRDSDGSWSEGGHSVSKQTDVVEAGTYVMRTTASWDRPVREFQVRVSSDDGPGACCFLFFLALLFLWPLVTAVGAGQFESRKWEDSVFQPMRFGT